MGRPGRTSHPNKGGGGGGGGGGLGDVSLSPTSLAVLSWSAAFLAAVLMLFPGQAPTSSSISSYNDNEAGLETRREMRRGHAGGAPQRAAQGYAKRHFAPGAVRGQRGDLTGAEEGYSVAGRAEPWDAKAPFKLAFLQEKLGGLAEAEGRYLAAVRAGPRYAGAFMTAARAKTGSAKAWSNIGVLQEKAGNLAGAEER